MFPSRRIEIVGISRILERAGIIHLSVSTITKKTILP